MKLTKKQKIVMAGALILGVYLWIRYKDAPITDPLAGKPNVVPRYKVLRNISAGHRSSCPGCKDMIPNVVVKKGEILNGPMIQESFPVMCISSPCPPQTFWGIPVTRSNGKVFVHKIDLRKV